MSNNDSSEKLNIEELLLSGSSVRFSPHGYSMYPLIVPGRDEVEIIPIDNHTVRRGDVLVYRRPEDKLIIHRVYKVRNNMIYMVGDNQEEIEGPLPKDCVRGLMIGFCHKGRYYGKNNLLYILSWQVWLLLRPFRHKIGAFIHKHKRNAGRVS